MSAPASFDSVPATASPAAKRKRRRKEASSLWSLLDSSEKQFEIGDHRDPEEISRVIRDLGFDPIWKDWEAALHG